LFDKKAVKKAYCWVMCNVKSCFVKLSEACLNNHGTYGE